MPRAVSGECDYVVQIAAAAGVRRVALTHHDPSHNDHFVADIKRKARTLALQRGTGLDVFCSCHPSTADKKRSAQACSLHAMN
jgi:hypothetical protein